MIAEAVLINEVLNRMGQPIQDHLQQLREHLSVLLPHHLILTDTSLHSLDIQHQRLNPQQLINLMEIDFENERVDDPYIIDDVIVILLVFDEFTHILLLPL